ncbi:precorrin-6y C5,15-methyltransferase (decarboxylating) subunit CbiE [Novosphingobium sp. BL-52-GroH]|uniref:precorrin-6y C5,15-methyltransferase (decarboxylating) subunit CbiE n=1 Tax=Novosphingobium sp. BL-52-GroH TaxID=3349877 RepID=UPI00384C7E9F
MPDTPERPWLTIVGIGEDGLSGLADASRDALAQADLVTGAARHLALAGIEPAQSMPWPVPFEHGIAALLARRGRGTVMLVSGDPFWFGAGSVVTRHLQPGEWIAHPAPSTFGLAAARLGWPLETTACLGLHAAPFARLRPHLAPGQRALVLVRDGAAVRELARYVAGEGFGASQVTVLEALGGLRERVRDATADTLDFADIAHPVAVAIRCAGDGAVLPLASGIGDDWFAHDGQMTRRPVRALTLSALAPRPGEMLWDIGTGSGSIAIEWLLSHPGTRAIGFEADPVRAQRARANAAALGGDRLAVVDGRAPGVLAGHPLPDAVFIGGGLCADLLETLWRLLERGTRIVANAVTLESEALLAQWHAREGGSLMRVELAEAAPLGSKRGWKAHYPIVQWSTAR